MYFPVSGQVQKGKYLELDDFEVWVSARVPIGRPQYTIETLMGKSHPVHGRDPRICCSCRVLRQSQNMQVQKERERERGVDYNRTLRCGHGWQTANLA